MISQRRAVQLGVISATAVFAACIGVLVFQGDGTSDDTQAAKTQQVDAQAAAPSSNTLTLSAARTPVVHLQSAQH
jgi:hypothetical protein